MLTRRDDAALPAVVDVHSGVRVPRVDAEPSSFLPREEVLPHMFVPVDVMQRLLQKPSLAREWGATDRRNAAERCSMDRFIADGLDALATVSACGRFSAAAARAQPALHSPAHAAGSWRQT